MDNKLLKGDYLIMDEGVSNNTVYLCPKNNSADIVEAEENSSEEEALRVQFENLEKEFEGQIIKVYKNNLVVAVPIEKEAMIKAEDNISIRIIKENSAYECSLKVLGIKNEGDKLLAVLSMPVVEKNVDRRRFFRINLKFGVRYCILPKGTYRTIIDVPKGCFLKIKKALTLDISAGGISLLSEDECEAGDYVLVCLYLPNKMDVLCQVLRVEPNYNNTKKSVLYMKYVYIYEQDRDRVVGFVIKNEVFRRNKNRENSIT